MNSTNISTTSLFTKNSLLAATAGAGGGLLSFFVGEIINGLTHVPQTNVNVPDSQVFDVLLQVLVGSAFWSGAIGLTIGAAILIYDNIQSLRGQWNRDILGGLPLFFGLSFLGGIAGQLFYFISQNSLTRGIGWALVGASVGMGIGLLRRDMIQMGRGTLGGAIGGFIGGFIFDALLQVSRTGNGSFSRLIGQIIMGALIALLMRVVQEALKNAWLLGISTGPYEGKEYPLNTAKVTVGRDDSNAIALYRERELPANVGAILFKNNLWFWEGNSILINGAPQSNVPLNPGDTLMIGSTRFRFQNRSVKSPSPASNYPSYPTKAPAYAYEPAPQTVVSQPFSPPTIRATPKFALMALSGQLLQLPDLTTAVSVGRTAANQIVLADAGVSASHARLQIINGALLVTDLGSTNGTFINGVKIPQHAPQELRPNDRIRFGQLEYTIRTV